jgi:hypothetical protein
LQLELQPLVVVHELEQVLLQRWEHVFELVEASRTGWAAAVPDSESTSDTMSGFAIPFIF